MIGINSIVSTEVQKSLIVTVLLIQVTYHILCDCASKIFANSNVMEFLGTIFSLPEGFWNEKKIHVFYKADWEMFQNYVYNDLKHPSLFSHESLQAHIEQIAYSLHVAITDVILNGS